MKKQLYPAVLERGPKGAFGAWFPDFPGCVAGGRSHEQTIERAENVLAQAVDRMFEHGRPLPTPTPIARIVLPKGCDFLAYFIVGVDPPDPSERVNVYLPKSLIGQIDRRAADCARTPPRLHRRLFGRRCLGSQPAPLLHLRAGLRQARPNHGVDWEIG